MQVGADEVQRRAVLGRVARAHAVGDELAVRVQAPRLGVDVHAVRVRQQPEPGDRRRRAGRANIVTAWSNQHSEPALTPHSTTPRRQHSRSTSSSPCARHTPSRLVTLPPPT